jgi:hypothetical protein
MSSSVRRRSKPAVMPKIRRARLAHAFRTQTSGAAIRVKATSGLARRTASASGFLSAICFGTSSPNRSDRNVTDTTTRTNAADLLYGATVGKRSSQSSSLSASVAPLKVPVRTATGPARRQETGLDHWPGSKPRGRLRVRHRLHVQDGCDERIQSQAQTWPSSH